MKPLSHIFILLLLIAVGLSACDKAPDGIIKESKMEDLLVDLYKAEAYIENHPEEFNTDSSKLVLKQAVYNKYHITQADYDTSLVWYAHNIETYDKVYHEVINRLTDEQKKYQKSLKSGGSDQNGSSTAGVKGINFGHQVYDSHGDTANVWKGDNMYVLLPGMTGSYIKFDLSPDGEYKSGDRYRLDMKLLAFNNNFTIFLAADYTDGSTSFISRTSTASGWFTMDLQTDTGRTVDRVYGYLRCDMRAQGAAFVDSIQLLRTHFNQADFGYITVQRFMSPNKGTRQPGRTPAQREPLRQVAVPPKPQQRQYAPKPGVNKGGIDHHGNQPLNRPAMMQ